MTIPQPKDGCSSPHLRQQLKNRASNGCNAVLSSYSYNQFCPCFPDICSYCNVMLYISCYVKGSHFESGGHWAQVRAMKKNWGGQIWRTWKYNYLHVWEKKHQHGSCNVLAPGFRVRSGLNCWLGTTAQGLAQALSKLVLLFKAGMATSLWEGFISWFRVFLQDPDTSCFLKGWHSISRVRHKKKFRRNGGLRKLCILVENMGFRMVSGLVWI